MIVCLMSLKLLLRSRHTLIWGCNSHKLLGRLWLDPTVLSQDMTARVRPKSSCLLPRRSVWRVISCDYRNKPSDHTWLLFMNTENLIRIKLTGLARRWPNIAWLWPPSESGRRLVKQAGVNLPPRWIHYYWLACSDLHVYLLYNFSTIL